ncbi:phage integrase N-terminal SAM-like domain-containing protein [Rubellicoccus peritrichatus]|uniref:Phage integrase N-terminal SAM-like domain-containing protein n=1 Tax=Rubellicoccus peritrichatus TaxID=3080537 RepID=A0AAQ3L7Q8_9BACT|nr:phage integrase N-terminal SAM-like domain-containing protein [Puniceicoccus sp. CR14]WOO40413.1 phage integrase N-terminal SAM-like domain-containing protein [Puniceicoccus sp. CR14]WOO40462.1 phage integrase N-terminal SAM-like domain-containing protein [Puniceicoccus sp. CR14]WOO40511.1 phage integrase N-terminal SAM-like domain-containing protein [Puniceicoccus sp. CR14]WOO40561.1 phage integrase N-terminal SAM-like domain-containing protein [Puniceicoccus sp. CR14]
MRSNFALSPEQKQLTRLAVAEAEGTGFNFLELVRIGKSHIGHSSVTGSGPTVSEVCDKWLLECLNRVRSGQPKPMSMETLEFYQDTIPGFLDQHGNKRIGELTRNDVVGYLEGLKLSVGSINCHHRAIRALFGYACSLEPPLIPINPAQKLKLRMPNATARKDYRAKDESGKPRILEFDDIVFILRGAKMNLRASAALGIFAGLRPHEIAPGGSKPAMTWERDINLSDRIITLTNVTSKGESGRILDGDSKHFDVIWEWLESIPKEMRKGPVCKIMPSSVTKRWKQLAGYANRGKTIRDWPHDAIRHTHCTYHVAYFADPAATAKNLGHRNQDMLYQNYQGMGITKAMASNLAELRP